MAHATGSLHALRSSVRLTKVYVGAPPHQKVFETELRFILREPRSKIARAVTQPTGDARISFNRSPKHFPAILEYMSCPSARAWKQAFPDEGGLLEFLEEAEFYGLEALATEIQAALHEVRRANVYVGAGFEFLTIGAAIAACADGQRVIVAPGTYEEHLHISKDVSIIAMDSVTAPAAPSAATGGKRGGHSVVIQFASNSVVSVSGSVLLQNVTIKRILRTGFERKNVIVNLEEDAVTHDNTTEFEGAAVRAVNGGSLKMLGCSLMSATDSMLSIETGCCVDAHHCTFSKARGIGISCRGRLRMRNCDVAGATDSAIVVELGSLDIQHCTISATGARSCLISRSSSVTCTHSTFSGCSGPCIRLQCVGTLTADVFGALLEEHSPAMKHANESATLAQNGCDPGAVMLLLVKFQSLATAAPARATDLQTMTLKQLKDRLLIGETMFKNCVVKDCSSMGMVCCGGSVRLVEVSLQSSQQLAVLVQDGCKLSVSSCHVSNCTGSAMWARSHSVVMAVGLHLENNAVSGLVVDGSASVRLIDSSICSSGRSAVSVINGAVYMRGVVIARNKHCGLETCSEVTCATLLGAHHEVLHSFKPVLLSPADAAAPSAMLLELQACDFTGNGDGIVLESKRKIFDSEPIFTRIQFIGNSGHGCSLLSACCNPLFRDCLFRDNAACGAYFGQSGKGVLSNCKIENNGRCAAHVTGLGTFCCLRDCSISRHAVAGLMLEESSGGEVKDCTFAANAVAVITLSNAAPVMTRCLISACSGTAVVCGPNSAGKYDACVFSDNKGLSVSIESSARPFLQSCSFSPAVDTVNAITCCPASEGNISNCSFESVGSVALVLQRDSDVRVAHCSIKGCTQFGILCMPGAKGSLEYNTVCSCWKAGCAIMSAHRVPSATKLVGNSFESGMDGAVAVYGAAAAAAARSDEA